jgi:hypothetical protein
VLTLNADQFGNFLSGPTLLAATDTIAVDGDVSANLGTLTPFGGDVLAGMTLGGAQNGSYIVDMGTSGISQVFMEGTGIHQVTGSLTKETFILGADQGGGSTISGLRPLDQIDIGADGTKLQTNVATAAEVDAVSEWNYSGGVLTWFAEGTNTVEALTLQFAAGSNLSIDNNRQGFTVI